MDGFRRMLGSVISILIKSLRSQLATVHGLDFGIPAEKTGLQHLCIKAISPAWERANIRLAFIFYVSMVGMPMALDKCYGIDESAL